MALFFSACEARDHLRTPLARNVIALGLVSLLTDASSEMIVPLLPLFVTTVLGGAATMVGAIEGSAEAVASLLKLVAGRLSDQSRRRKRLVVLGYSISSLARPLIALALVPSHVLAIRIADRVGKGLRTSPRDALLSESVEPSARARAFGFHRAMDHAGAVIGPLAALGVLTLSAASLADDLRLVFLAAAVPGALALLVLMLGARDVAKSIEGPEAPEVAPRAAWPLLAPLGLFTLGRASEAFLLLRVQQAGAGPKTLLSLWAILHVVKSASSYASGPLVERVGTRAMITAGWLMHAGILTAFAVTSAPLTLMLLFVAYGLFHGLSEAPERALVAALVPSKRRGTAFGVYHGTVGLLSLVSGLWLGWVWDGSSASIALGLAAAVATAATLVLQIAWRAGSTEAPLEQ